MNAMKNIKKPAYAVELGKGVFVGATYIHQCTKCGLTIQDSHSWGPPGPCPAGFVHKWCNTRI